MSNKILVSIIAFFGIVFTLTLIVGGIWLYRQSAPVVSINFSETAKDKISPESAKIRAFITSTDSDLVKINRQTDEKLKSIIDYLTSEGIDSKNIRTNKSSYPDYSYNPNMTPDQEKRQTLQASVEIKINNIQEKTTKATEILNKLLELGVNQFDNWQYEYQNNLSSVCRNLEADATKKVNEKFSDYNYGEVVAIDYSSTYDACNQNYDFVSPYMDRSISIPSEIGSSSLPPDLYIGEKEVSVTVNAIARFRNYFI
jgi:uncharacterized protein YggE